MLRKSFRETYFFVCYKKQKFSLSEVTCYLDFGSRKERCGLGCLRKLENANVECDLAVS